LANGAPGAETQDDLTDDQLMRKLAVLTELARPLLAKLPVIDAKGLEVAAPSFIDQECGASLAELDDHDKDERESEASRR
jgi:hypothetical protein